MTADITYAQKGLMNQNVYSPNLTNNDQPSAADFNTEQNDYEDPLQTEPENAGEVTDTDNYRGENINNDLQYIEEQYVAEDEVQVAETVYAENAMEHIFLLQQYRDRIRARGVGIVDITTLENHLPGLIGKGPEPWTYKPSQGNKQYALEAIDEQIKAKGKQVIDWILKKLQQLISWISNVASIASIRKRLGRWATWAKNQNPSRRVPITIRFAKLNTEFNTRTLLASIDGFIRVSQSLAGGERDPVKLHSDLTGVVGIQSKSPGVISVELVTAELTLTAGDVTNICAKLDRATELFLGKFSKSGIFAKLMNEVKQEQARNSYDMDHMTNIRGLVTALDAMRVYIDGFSMSSDVEDTLRGSVRRRSTVIYHQALDNKRDDDCFVNGQLVGTNDEVATTLLNQLWSAYSGAKEISVGSSKLVYGKLKDGTYILSLQLIPSVPGSVLQDVIGRRSPFLIGINLEGDWKTFLKSFSPDKEFAPMIKLMSEETGKKVFISDSTKEEIKRMVDKI